MNGRCQFSLFQVEFHVQESDGHFGDLVGKFVGGMEILHKVDKIQMITSNILLHRKFARFVLFLIIKKRSFNLLCVLEQRSMVCFIIFTEKLQVYAHIKRESCLEDGSVQ